MGKKTVAYVVAGVLILVLGVASAPARAEYSLKILTGQYSPHLRKINEDFDKHWNNQWGTDFEFKGGAISGLALGCDVGPRFEIRLEGYSFESKTGDTYRKSWEDSSGLWEYYYHEDFKLTVAAVIVLGIYKFSPFYVGAGVGSFSSKQQWVQEYNGYLNGFWMDSYSWSKSDTDSPGGLVVLAGFSFGYKPVSLNLEARYVMLAKGKLEINCHTWDTEADLSGLQLSLLAGVTFR